jgi:hypothetical protein
MEIYCWLLRLGNSVGPPVGLMSATKKLCFQYTYIMTFPFQFSISTVSPALARVAWVVGASLVMFFSFFSVFCQLELSEHSVDFFLLVFCLRRHEYRRKNFAKLIPSSILPLHLICTPHICSYLTLSCPPPPISFASLVASHEFPFDKKSRSFS